MSLHPRHYAADAAKRDAEATRPELEAQLAGMDPPATPQEVDALLQERVRGLKTTYLAVSGIEPGLRSSVGLDRAVWEQPKDVLAFRRAFQNAAGNVAGQNAS